MRTEIFTHPYTGGDEITTVERRDFISPELCPSCLPDELYDSYKQRVPTGNGTLLYASPTFGVDDVLLIGGILKIGGKAVAKQIGKSGVALAGRQFSRAISASFKEASYKSLGRAGSDFGGQIAVDTLQGLVQKLKSGPRAVPKGSGRAPSASPPLLGLPSPRTATQIRNTPGGATGGFELPNILGQWLRGSHGNAGLMPKQIADQLRGRSFRDFGHFRGEFWKAVANDPALSQSFGPANLVRMHEGLAPYVVKGQRLGGQKSYIPHHATPIQHGGGVYDLNNLMIVTPRYHKEILDPSIHY